MLKTTYRNLEPYSDINQNIHKLATICGEIRMQSYFLSDLKQCPVRNDEMELLYRTRDCINGIIRDIEQSKLEAGFSTSIH